MGTASEGAIRRPTGGWEHAATAGQECRARPRPRGGLGSGEEAGGVPVRDPPRLGYGGRARARAWLGHAELHSSGLGKWVEAGECLGKERERPPRERLELPSYSRGQGAMVLQKYKFKRR